MNVEVFSYSVLASILGILIVFLSLCALSLLMVVLKVIFRERKEETPVADVTKPSGPAVTAVQRVNNDWIMAAVAAFLAGEDENAPSAGVWSPGLSEKSDPWINRAAFDKKLG